MRWELGRRPASQEQRTVSARRGRQWCGPKCRDGNLWAPRPGGSGRAGLQVTRPPPTAGALPARLQGLCRSPGDLGASAERKRAQRQPRDGGDAAWQRGGGSAASVPPAFVLAAACGARPGAMKGPSVCAPAAPLGFHS